MKLKSTYIKYYLKIALITAIFPICSLSNAQVVFPDSDGDGVYDSLDPEPNIVNNFPIKTITDKIDRKDYYSREILPNGNPNPDFKYGLGFEALNHNFDWKPSFPINTDVQIKSVSINGTIDDWLLINGSHAEGNDFIWHVKRNAAYNNLEKHLDLDQLSGDNKFNFKIYDFVDEQFPETSPGKNESYIDVQIKTEYYELVPKANLTAYHYKTNEEVNDDIEDSSGALISKNQAVIKNENSKFKIHKIFNSNRYFRRITITNNDEGAVVNSFGYSQLDEEVFNQSGQEQEIIFEFGSEHNALDISYYLIGNTSHNSNISVKLEIIDSTNNNIVDSDLVIFRPIAVELTPNYIRPTISEVPSRRSTVFNPLILSPLMRVNPKDENQAQTIPDKIYSGFNIKVSEHVVIDNVLIKEVRARLIYISDAEDIEVADSVNYVLGTPKRTFGTGLDFDPITVDNPGVEEGKNYQFVYDAKVIVNGQEIWLEKVHSTNCIVNWEAVRVARRLVKEEGISDLGQSLVLQTIINRFYFPDIAGSTLNFGRSALQVNGVTTILDGINNAYENIASHPNITFNTARMIAYAELQKPQSFDSGKPIYFHTAANIDCGICRNSIDSTKLNLLTALPRTGTTPPPTQHENKPGNQYYALSGSLANLAFIINRLPVNSTNRLKAEEKYRQIILRAYQRNPNDSLQINP